MNLNKSSKYTKKPKENIKTIQWIVIFFMALCSCISMFSELQFFAKIKSIFQIFILWILADFITGVVHWWEDTYGNPNWPIIGKYVVKPNLIHHKQPAKLLEGSYWSRINTSFFAALIIGVIFWLCNLLSWKVTLCLLFCVQANEIHAMSHRPDRKNSKITLFMQKIGIFQSKKMHRWHHKAPYETNFCIMSNFVNPILNKIEFWRKIEWVILKVFKITVLRTSQVRDGL